MDNEAADGTPSESGALDRPLPAGRIPERFVRDRVLPYPKGHARRMTILGFVIAAVTFGLTSALLGNRGPTLAFHNNGYTPLFFLAALALVPLHEGLHVVAALVRGMPRQRIQLGFQRGFIYVRFHQSLSVSAMRVVLLVPLVLLGIPLFVFCLRSMDRQWLVLFSAHVGSTVVDLYTWWRLRGLEGDKHVFQEPGVHGLTVFRAPDGGALAGRPLPALASSLAVTAVTTLLFVVGPFLVPSHELLGDRTLRRQRDMLTGKPLPTAVIGDEDGWQTATYDFHVLSAGSVRCTARAWRSGRLVSRETTEIPVTDGSGSLHLRWGIWPPGVGPGRFAVRLAHGRRDVELISVSQAVTARSTTLRVADDHRVRLDHSLPVLHRFVTGDDLPAAGLPTEYVAGSPPDRGGLPPGLEVEVRLTFIGADD